MLAFGGRIMRENGLGRQLGCGTVELTLAQGVQKTARERDPLPLPRGETLLNQIVDARVHRVPQLGSKCVSHLRRMAGDKLSVRPGRASGGDLRVDGEVRPNCEREPIGVHVGADFDYCSWLGVAGQLEVGEPQVMGPTVDPFNDCIGCPL
jgi:hypothetical protein